MKICLIGDFSENLDEGLKNIAHNLAEELSKHHVVMKSNVKKIFSLEFWVKIREFNPQIIHYIPGPTIKSFLIVKVLKSYNNSKTIVSAPQPQISSFSKNLIPLTRPDLILVQSAESEKMFAKLGCRTKFLPNGVNTKKFVPVPQNVKEKLREKYGIDNEKFTVLHVGHITQRRNIELFTKIQREGCQVILVASEYLKVDHRLYESLTKSGCVILKGFFENIEEIYAMSDCYIFPVQKGDTILSPLSVMEAMSCNLPVISTKFEGLTRIFEEGEGLIFVEKEQEIVQELENLRSNNSLEIKTREKVLPYSWENIARKLNKIYEGILIGER